MRHSVATQRVVFQSTATARFDGATVQLEIIRPTTSMEVAKHYLAARALAGRCGNGFSARRTLRADRGS